MIFLFILLIAAFSSLPYVKAIDTKHTGVTPIDAVLQSNFSIRSYAGRFTEEISKNIDLLSNNGYKINYGELWWGNPEDPFDPDFGNPIELFYNETYRNQVEAIFDYNFNGTQLSFQDPQYDWSHYGVNPDSLWSVTLSDEEPSWTRWTEIYTELSPEIAKYSDIYQSETGFELKPLFEMNMTEYSVAVEWINAKSVWTFNHLHDYVKANWPHLLVFQYMTMVPVWGLADELCAPYELRADGYVMDCYTSHSFPWILYETTRRYKTAFRDKPFLLDIWGTIWDFLNEAGDGLYYQEGSFEQIRRESWLSYLSGVDILGWFDWGPENNDSYNWKWGQERTDKFGRKIMAYVDTLAGELSELPVFKPMPEVMVIGNGYQTGDAMTNVAEVGLFTEYDLMNQRCFSMTDVDLSDYSLVLLTDIPVYDETISKLNEYVKNGGNLILLGGIRNPDELLTSELFPIEENTSESILNTGHTRINITTPNLISLNLEYEGQFHITSALHIENITEDFYPIGDFYLVDESGNTSKMDDYPLVLYHDLSNPQSGWILYWGALHSSTVEGTTNENYDSENQIDLWFLYKQVVRSFADFLNITNSISSNETEEMLITQGIVEKGTLLTGIQNFKNEEREFTYSLDLSKFDYPDGDYWIHSLDENSSMGQHTSTGQILRFNVQVPPNGTRLLLISTEKPSPDYAIEIFPNIPEVSDLPEDYTLTYILIGSLVVIVSLIAIIIVWRRRKRG
jgi:hypothetical protein